MLLESGEDVDQRDQVLFQSFLLSGRLENLKGNMDLNCLRTSLFMRDDFLIPLRHLAFALHDIGVNRDGILNFF